MTRQIPKDIGNYPFDLIVVGAGINGAGIARDASMRGLKVLLLDKGDISDGTTQWSTRLIHGGLRYLEYYEVHLVRESLAEREKLLHIAPHLVKPLRFVVPIYERSKRGPGMVRLGMIGYDVLSFDKSVPNHKMLSREQALERYPGLNPEGLLGAATYYDGQVEYAERIAVENAISAREHGATVVTPAEVRQLLFEEPANGGLPRVSGVGVGDKLDGGVYKAHCAVTVNVAGPWVDRVLSGAGSFGIDDAPEGESGEREQMIGGTKGSHLIVDPFPGAPQDALYVEARADGRPDFIVPWKGRYPIGPTDLPDQSARHRPGRPLGRGPPGRRAVLYGAVERPLPYRHHRLPLQGRPRPRLRRRRRDRLPDRRDERRRPDGEPDPRGRALHLLRRKAFALQAAGLGELDPARPRRLRPRRRALRRRRQAHGGWRRPEGRGPHLHRRRQAHHLPQPRPPDGERRLQEARPGRPGFHHGQGSPARRSGRPRL